jgi:hypothetical protein
MITLHGVRQVPTSGTIMNRACLGFQISLITDHGAWTPKERRARQGRKTHWPLAVLLACAVSFLLWKMIF